MNPAPTKPKLRDPVRVKVSATNIGSPQWARFWSKVDTSAGEEACWMWTAGVDKNGYGQFTWSDGEKSQNLRSHKISHLLHGGVLSEQAPWVLHKCHQTGCCNPAHLKSGTPKENMADKFLSGRANSARGENHGSRKDPSYLLRGDKHWTKTTPWKVPCGDRHWSKHLPESTPKGERHHGAKLTENDVREIRALKAEGVVTQKYMASKFGVATSVISTIVNGKRWKHV